jgi:hypothetical protein
VVFGLAPVRHVMANMLSEIAVGYPESPLNSSYDFRHGGPAPGKRAPIREGETPVGGGSTPRFVLFAAEGDAHARAVKEFAEILEPKLRTPYDTKGLWLVRPDGYIALCATNGDTEAVRKYLCELRS